MPYIELLVNGTLLCTYLVRRALVTQRVREDDRTTNKSRDEKSRTTMYHGGARRHGRRRGQRRAPLPGAAGLASRRCAGIAEPRFDMASEDNAKTHFHTHGVP